MRVAVSWSSGKDSAWALHLLRQDPSVEVVALVTTLNEQFDRVAMHAVRHQLLDLQAASVGLPLWTVPLPWPCSNEQYEARMRDLCARAIAEHVDAMAFGDLLAFLRVPGDFLGVTQLFVARLFFVVQSLVFRFPACPQRSTQPWSTALRMD